MRTLPLVVLLCTLAGAQDGARPAFEAVLCQAWDAQSRPEGITDRFFADNASVRVVLRGATPAAGHRLMPSVMRKRDGEWVEVLRGNATVTDGKSNTFGLGFLLAGRAWAQEGGEFRFLVTWDDESEPLVDLPFTVALARRWALLVGISDYPPAGPGGGDLPASAKDAERMRDLLVGSFGFDASRITLVLDGEATSARLDRELTALADRAGPDDAVLFYYCGHGTQVPDLDGDEEDGWDEALATADPRPALLTTADSLKLVLSDDRIAELLARFKTRNVTVIFDSCHSGTAVRAGDEEEALLEGPGFRQGMRHDVGVGRQLVQMAEDADRTAPKGVAAGLDVDERYVFLSAARSWETGMTDPEGCFFSRHLREAMRTANGESWETLLDRVRPLVQASNPGQSPQALGAVRRFPFSLAEAPADAPYQRPSVAVVGAWRADQPNSIWVGGVKGQVALVSGMDSLYQENAGVVYDVYPDGATPGEGAAKGRVTLTGRMQAIQRPNMPPLSYAAATIDEGDVRRGDRLVPRTVKVPDARPSIGLTLLNNTPQNVVQQLQSVVRAVLGLLGKESGVRLVTSGSVAQLDYIVVPMMKDGVFLAGVYTPLSQNLGTCKGTPEEIAARVRELVVQRHAEYTRISRIANPSPPFRLRVVAEGGAGRREPGSELGVRGYAGRAADLSVFTALEGGPLSLAAKSDRALAPDEPFSFRIRTEAGRKGRLVVYVYATEKPWDVDAVAKAPPGGRADALLRELTKACPARGAPGALGTDGWASASLRIELR